jgi:pyridinium-3,5-biscarboxylic acid mononucleotide synthase
MTDTLTIDFDRHRRLGFPEVVFGANKTVNETVAAATRLVEAHRLVLITRATIPALEALHKALPAGRPWPRSGCFSVGMPEPTAGPVAIVSAGTSDESVAEEAVVTARMRGVAVKRFPDCGVAGVHRFLDRLEEIRSCHAVVVIAGMDGALPSVVGGLVDIPVIACPTSVG